MATSKQRQKIEFGDFQTPVELARRVCEVVSESGLRPAAILEPTCGQGSMLVAAAERFPGARLVGFDRNPDYVATARAALAARGFAADIRVGDFFGTDWKSVTSTIPDPLLVIGNPPWVTNAALSALGSSNVPEKTNYRKETGVAAITGKSNFDISEWILLRVLEWLKGRQATMAMLCKLAVSRKALASAWKEQLPIARAEVRRIDSMEAFGAAVDAGLLLCEFSPAASMVAECEVKDLDGPIGQVSRPFGLRDGHLIARLDSYERWKRFATGSRRRWRSGIKHDCTSVMEFREVDGTLRNGLGVEVRVEPAVLFPMLKTSELAGTAVPAPRRWMLVPQTSVGEDTTALRRSAPLAWQYLEAHGEALDKRGSSIYKNRPRFSIFGVGEYTFAPWKVAISGFYKKLVFRVIGPHAGKPVVLDDLSYFLGCQEQAVAEQLAAILNSAVAREFFEAFIFWDAKRPITVDVLSRLDIDALAAYQQVPLRRETSSLLDLAEHSA